MESPSGVRIPGSRAFDDRIDWYIQTQILDQPQFHISCCMEIPACQEISYFSKNAFCFSCILNFILGSRIFLKWSINKDKLTLTFNCLAWMCVKNEDSDLSIDSLIRRKVGCKDSVITHWWMGNLLFKNSSRMLETWNACFQHVRRGTCQSMYSNASSTQPNLLKNLVWPIGKFSWIV